MSEPTTLQALGLWTSPNELTAPAGGMRKAQNAVMLAPGIIGARRGMPALSYAPSFQATAMALFGNAVNAAETVIAFCTDGAFRKDTGSAWTDLGAVTNSALLFRMKFAQASQNLYANPTSGTVRIDSLTKNPPQFAGGAHTQQIKTAAVNGTASGFLSDGYSVAYRLVFGTIDAHGTIILGVPSGRFTVDNTSGAAHNTDLTFLAQYVASAAVVSSIPIMPQASFWQLYRTYTTKSFQTNDGGVSVYVPPDDEMYLCQEAFFLDADVASGVSITDTTPDDFLGAPLYTNAIRGDGTLSRNEYPPTCIDLCTFDQRMFYANTTRAQYLQLQILGVGAGQDGYTGIRLGDTLTFWTGGATTYSFRAATTYSEADRTFLLYTADPDASVNINKTAQSLINLINSVNPSGAGSYLVSWLAEDLSTPDGPGVAGTPGVIGIQGLSLNTPQFFASVNTYKFPVASGNLSRAANVVTVTTTGNHGLVTGDTVRIDPTGSADANFPAGTFTATVTGLASFTYPQVNAFNGVSAQPYTERRITPEPQYAWNKPPPPSTFNINSGGLVRTGGTTVTVTTSASQAHGLSVGQMIAIEPTTTPDTNFAAGTFTVLTVPSASTFTYTQAGSNTTNGTGYQSGQRVGSSSFRQYNGFSWSKIQQPEAVPLSQSGYAGTPDKQILRIIANDNYLYVFKEDGVYVITPTGNSAAPYRVNPLDLTFHVYAPDSVAKVHGKIYALGNQGVVEVTPSGCRVVSTPIEQDLFQYFGPTLDTLRTASFAVSHETDQLYILWVPPLQGGTGVYGASRAYVFCPRAVAQGSSGWTTWEVPRYCGVVRAYDDVLYTGAYSSTPVYVQNNTKTARDYADSATALTVQSWAAATRTITVASASGVLAGDGVLQSGIYAIVVSVDQGTKEIVLSGGTFAAGAATAYAAIPIDLEWRTVVGSSPADMKTFREIHLHSRLRDFYKSTLVFASELVTTEQTLAVYPAKGTDGVVPAYTADTTIYPGMPVRPAKLRVALPQAVARAAYMDIGFRISEAYALWWLNGFSLVDAPVSEKGQR